MKELVGCGAVVVERRSQGGVNQTNRYHVRTRRAASTAAGGGRTDAASPPTDRNQDVDVAPPAAGLSAASVAAGAGGGRGLPGGPTAATAARSDPEGSGRIRAAGSRSAAASPAAAVRPNPEFFTQSQPSPQTPAVGGGTGRLQVLTDLELTQLRPTLQAVGLTADGLPGLAGACQRLREQAAQPTGRWTARCLAAGLHLAVQRGLDPGRAVAALLVVAADPQTRSPMRLAEAGPWWDPPPAHISCSAQSRKTSNSPASKPSSPTATTAPSCKPTPAPAYCKRESQSVGSTSPASPPALQATTMRPRNLHLRLPSTRATATHTARGLACGSPQPADRARSPPPIDQADYELCLLVCLRPAATVGAVTVAVHTTSALLSHLHAWTRAGLLDTNPGDVA